MEGWHHVAALLCFVKRGLLLGCKFGGKIWVLWVDNVHSCIRFAVRIARRHPDRNATGRQEVRSEERAEGLPKRQIDAVVNVVVHADVTDEVKAPVHDVAVTAIPPTCDDLSFRNQIHSAS